MEGGCYRCSEDESVMKRCRRFSSESSKQQEKEKNAKLSLFLQDELVFEILEWLPIKSLVRFRCVAKHWSALFKCPTFIKNHRHKQGSKGTMLLVRRCLPSPQVDGNDAVLSFHDLDSPEAEVRPSLSITFLKDVLGFERIPLAFNFLGTCNGIVCINYGHRHILCNPALREFRILPPCCPQDCEGKWRALGFGVSSCAADDFKVIVLHDTVSDLKNNIKGKKYLMPSVMGRLYSSRTNSWRRIDDALVFPIVACFEDYIFLNGACHWLGLTYDNCKTILSLDINSEVFRQLELPDCFCRLDIALWRPIVLNECLVGLVNYQNPMRWLDGLVPVEVWAMEEYGVKESWTKKFVISPQPLTSTYLPWKNDILLMVHEPKYDLDPDLRIRRKDGELDEQFNGQLTSISLHTDELKKFQVYGAQQTMHLLKYEESLVSLY